MTSSSFDYIIRGGIEVNIEATREIIISCGAVNSPILLMQSGIGPTHRFEITLPEKSFMSFILVPLKGEDLVVNAWNWRPTLELLFAAGVITEDDYELLGCQGSGARVNEEKARRIADAVARKLESMNPGQRMPADLSTSSEAKQRAVFKLGNNDKEVDTNELYSTTFEWLHAFVGFCERSGGFRVM